MGNTMTNFRLTLSLVQASGSIHLLQDHKGVYTSQSTFLHISSPQKMLPHCRHANDAARAFTISCSWLAAAFFFLHLSSCFYYLHTMLSTSVQGHRHLQLGRTTIRSPTDLNKSNVGFQKFKATALADVTSFKVPTKD